MKGAWFATDNSYLIERLDVEGMRKALNLNNDVPKFGSRNDAIVFIKQFDMMQALNLPKNHKCLFHDDRHASAGIFKNADGIYLYKCHSPNCAFYKCDDIFGMTKELAGVDFNTALNFWFDVLGITYCRAEKTLDSVEKNDKILRTKQFIKGENGSEAMKIIGKNIEILYALYDIASGVAVSIENSGVLVGASEREISGHLDSVMKISRGLAILAYFGLIRRMPIFEIKDRRRQKLMNIRQSNMRARFISQTLVLFVDDEDKMRERMKNAAADWIKFGHRTRDFTFANVARRENIFKANELFPNK